MKLRNAAVIPFLALTAGLALSACGSADRIAGTATVSAVGAITSVNTAAAPSKTAAPVAAQPAPVKTAEIAKLGNIVVGANGLTLYGFTDDKDGTSTCDGACAAAWPPLVVQGGALPEGLDSKVFSVVDRADGTKQLKAGKWPLYFYAGDAAIGDTNGQGSGDKWFVVTPAGKLVKPGAAEVTPKPSATPSESASPSPKPAKRAEKAPVSAATVAELGKVLVGNKGLTLYGFTNDKDGTSTCVDACATAWPPVTVTGELPDGLDDTVFSVIDRADGTKQLKAGKWPLYYYAGDGKRGEATGQGSGDKWFAVTPVGKLVKSAPEPAAKPAPEPKPSADPYAPAGQNAVNLQEVANLGVVMVGANGHTLYAFTDDPEKQSTCFDACAKAWPPVLVKDGFTVPEEYQGLGVDTFLRPDGARQLVMGKWALYYYAGDNAPGEANGQGVNGKWYTVDAACKLVKTPVS